MLRETFVRKVEALRQVPCGTVDGLRKLVASEERHKRDPASSQGEQLIFAGRPGPRMQKLEQVCRCLSDDEILADCLTEDGLQFALLCFALLCFAQESTVFVTAGLDGGGKKRKKKTYTKPKILAV